MEEKQAPIFGANNGDGRRLDGEGIVPERDVRGAREAEVGLRVPASDARSRLNVYRVFVDIILRHPFAVVLIAAVGVALSLLMTATHLEFHTDRRDLIASGDRYTQLNDAYRNEFEELPEGVIVAIRSKQPERAKAFAIALAQRWEVDPNIERVLYRINVDALKHKGLLYLSPEDLLALRQKLQDHQDLLQELAAAPTLQNLFALVNRETTTALVGHVFTGFLEADGKQEPPDLSVLLALLRQMTQWLDGSRAYRSPWATMFTPDAEASSYDGFLWSDDKRLLFVLADPKKEAGEFSRFQRAVQHMRADVRALQQAYPDVEVGITGKDVLDADEMGVAQRDTTIATVIAAVGVTLLYFVMFKGVVRPLLALVTLGIGVGWTLGWTTFTIGHLNIFSIVFMPMLMGLGIDYGSYLIARYEEERAAGHRVQEALVRTFVATGPGIATTALTTALAFGTLLLTGFTGLAELGFIGGSGILLAALATFTVLPAMLVLHERRRPVGTAVQGRPREVTRAGYLELLYRRPWATLAASALLVGLSLLALGRVRADFNLLHLQAEGTESVVWVHKIFASAKRSLLYGEVVADSLSDVTRKATALKALPSVAEVDSLAAVLPMDQVRKLPLIRELRPLLAGLAFQRDPAAAIDLDALRMLLRHIQFKMVEDGEAAGGREEEKIRQEMQEVRRLIAQFVDTTERMGNAAALQALSAFQEELLADLAEQLATLQANLRAEPVTLADLPPELRTRYIGKSGKYRLFVYPAEDIWELQPLARFVADLRSVDPDALGTPITNFEFTHGIKKAYEQAGLYAFLGIALLVLLTFRAVRPTLLALIPLAVGALWTLGLMGLLQVRFNVANLIVLPLIMAPAVESGIMIVYRYRTEGHRSPRPVPLPSSTGRAVAFSALSTIVGFGSLTISSHRGILSLGLLLMFGVSAVFLASLTVLPSFLSLLSARRRKAAEAPSVEDEPPDVASPVIAEPARHRGQALAARLALLRDPDFHEAVGAGATTGADDNGRRWGEE